MKTQVILESNNFLIDLKRIVLKAEKEKKITSNNQTKRELKNIFTSEGRKILSIDYIENIDI